jgi:hypothetical protein
MITDKIVVPEYILSFESLVYEIIIGQSQVDMSGQLSLLYMIRSIQAHPHIISEGT